MLGAIEAGGTKFVCAVSDKSLNISKKISIPTTSPEDRLIKNMDKGSELLVEQASRLFAEVETAVAAEQGPFAVYEGIYALFSDVPYESTIDYVFLLMSDTIIEGYRNSEYVVNEIVDKKLEEETLILTLKTPEQIEFSGATSLLRIERVYDEAGDDHLLFETGAALYPISVTDFTESGFIIPVGYEYWMEEFGG